MKTTHVMRSAFSILEVLISVVIISTSIIYILKIHGSNHEQVVYITERNKHTLEDSLFLGENTLRYHKDEKDAYELLRTTFRIEEDKTRELLKNIKREIYIPEVETVEQPDEDSQEMSQTNMQAPPAVFQELKLKGEYSSIYWIVRIGE